MTGTNRTLALWLMQTEHWHCDWCRQNTGTVTDAKGPLAYVHDCMVQPERWHCDWCKQNTSIVTGADRTLALWLMQKDHWHMCMDCMVQPERWHCDWCKYKTRTYGTKHCDWCRQNAATTIAADRMLVSWVMQTEHWYYDYHVVFCQWGAEIAQWLEPWTRD